MEVSVESQKSLSISANQSQRKPVEVLISNYDELPAICLLMHSVYFRSNSKKPNEFWLNNGSILTIFLHYNVFID